MTDRINGLTVTLEPNMREDDAQCIIDAILLLKGVASVTTHVADSMHHFAVEQAKAEMRKKIWEVVK